MKYRFTGVYSGEAQHTTCLGVTFYARNGTEIPAELVEKFERHPEYEQVKVRKAKKAKADG